MKYKLAVSDFDNTLAGKDCKISDYTKEVINEYVARGGKFVLNTGRTYLASKKFSDELGLKGELVTFQGAAVFNSETGEILYSDYIDKNTAVEIFKFFENYNYIVVHGYTSSEFYAQKDNPVTEQYNEFCGIKAIILNEKLSSYFQRTNENCLKIVAFVPSAEMNGLIKQINEKYGDTVYAMKSQSTFLEITNKNVSKGLAVKRLAELYGIKREEIMCFGDATNDISMIEYAGMGVAVDNAMPEVKSCADYISESALENGVAKTIVKFCFDGIEPK